MWVQSIISCSIFAPIVSTASQLAGQSLVEDESSVGSWFTCHKVLVVNSQEYSDLKLLVWRGFIFMKRSNSNWPPFQRDARQRGPLRKKKELWVKEIAVLTVLSVPEWPQEKRRKMMLAEKLQHLIVKLSQKMLRANVLGKCKKSKMRGVREVVVVENDYQRTELPAKADGQWILFRS